MLSLQDLETFMGFLHDVERVKRVARRPNEAEYTSTAEHTFELALLCWYIASSNNLTLNHEKIIKYALAHDLIEAYAGDSYIYDSAAQANKKEREAAALTRIETEFESFPELIEMIKEYERREDSESRFVYAVDKLIDPLTISMEKTEPLWKTHNVSYDQLRAYKDSKIALSPDVHHFWEVLIKKLEERKDFYFSSNDKAP